MTDDGDDEAFERALAARLAGRREDRLKRFSPEVLAWMGLPPLWTEELARRCGFPGLAPSLFRELAGVGLCEQGTLVVGDREEPTAWMPEPARGEVLASLRAGQGQRFVDERAEQIGTAVRSGVASHGLVLAAPIARWAALAAAGSGAPRELRARVRELVKAGDTGEALGWIEAARQLAGKVSARLGPALALCERQLEIAYRAAQDRRHLASFLERADQIRAVEELLDGAARPWALHLLGMGGVGKTMLVRHVIARLAPARGMPVARVDFDYLSPEYPLHRPEQLLIALADELAPYCTTDRQQASLASFERFTGGLVEALSDGALPGQPLVDVDVLHVLRRAEFIAVLRAFADLLGQLERPPLFVLDTCEELAKVEPADATVPGLDATFEILEQLHERVPGLRVLLAGRRLLAWSGPGWRAAEGAAREGRRRLAEEKSYLRLCVLRGFDRAEVDAYLARVLGARADETATRAILAQSGDTGELHGTLLEHDGGAAPGPRYNPFDVALFAAWLRDDPALDLGRLARGVGSDPYVELRILGRLESPALRRALPGLVLLRRFDRTATRLLLGGGDAELAAAHRALGEQEWVEHVTGGASGGALAIHAKLLPRLEAYYEHPDRRAEIEAVKRALASGLVDRLRAGELDVDTVDAALRVLPVAEAAVLWERLDRELVEHHRWGVAVALAARLLAEGGAVEAPDGPLRAAVRATHAEAIEHAQPGGDTTEAWAEVERAAGLHPDPSLAAWLAQRAVVGIVAAARARRGAPAPERLAELRRLVHAYPDATLVDPPRAARLASAICAALDVALDAAPVVELPPPAALGRFVGRVARLSGELMAFARMLAARQAARLRRWPSARRHFQAALAALPAASDAPGAGISWMSTAALRDRVRLELLVSGAWLLHKGPAREVERWVDEALERPFGIDAERLVSQIVRLGLERGTVAEGDLDRLEAHDRYDPGRAPICAAHREVPPLFVSIVEARAALGDRRRALALVDQRIREATNAGRDKLTVAVAQRAKLALWRRFRQPPEGLLGRLAGSSEPEDRVAAFPVMALCQGRAPSGAGAGAGAAESKSSTAVIHAWWRSQIGLPADEDARLLESYRSSASSRAAIEERDSEGLEEALDGIDLELDVRELDRLAVRLSSGSRASEVVLEPGWFAQHARVRRVLRIALRAGQLAPAALGGGSGIHAGWMRRLPPRLVAEAALEEAEVLSLRLPAAASRLFEIAQAAYVRSGDRGGAALAAIHRLVAVASGTVSTNEVKAIASRVEPVYEALRGVPTGAELPAWSSLTDWSHGEPFHGIEESPYEYVLYRLLDVLLWIADDEVSERRRRLKEVCLSRGDERVLTASLLGRLAPSGWGIYGAPPPGPGGTAPGFGGDFGPPPPPPVAAPGFGGDFGPPPVVAPAFGGGFGPPPPVSDVSGGYGAPLPMPGFGGGYGPPQAPSSDTGVAPAGPLMGAMGSPKPSRAHFSKMALSTAVKADDEIIMGFPGESVPAPLGMPEGRVLSELHVTPMVRSSGLKRGLLWPVVVMFLGAVGLIVLVLRLMGPSTAFASLRGWLMAIHPWRLVLSVSAVIAMLVLLWRRADVVALVARCIRGMQRPLRPVPCIVVSDAPPVHRAVRLILEESLGGVRVRLQRMASSDPRSVEPAPVDDEVFDVALPDAEATYADAARAVPAPACEALERLGASPAVAIELPRGVAALPWEAFFALAAAGWAAASRARDRSGVTALLRSRAPIYRLQRRKPIERPPWSGRVTMLGSSLAELGRGGGLWTRSTLAALHELNARPERFATDVLHLVGAPMRRAAGILLQVRMPSGDQVIDPEPWLRGAALVVLQLDPAEGYARTGTERAEMALLRELAVEAISAGPAHVVVLPALPERLVVTATQLLERCTSRAVPPTTAEILEALGAIREAICLAGESESHLVEGAELALDVGLTTMLEVDAASLAAGDAGPAAALPALSS